MALVALALRRRRQTMKVGPGPLASAVVVLLGIGTFAAMLTIGPLVIPVVGLLITACVRASGPTRNRPVGPTRIPT